MDSIVKGYKCNYRDWLNKVALLEKQFGKKAIETGPTKLNDIVLINATWYFEIITPIQYSVMLNKTSKRATETVMINY